MEQNQVTRMKKIACTLLVDDNENTNFLHQMLLEDMGITEEILFAGNGLEAINLIQKRISSKQACPELILLDINMPVMDGYEFMDAFEALNIKVQAPLIIAMLTIPLRSDDLQKLRSSTPVEFIKKPLTEENLTEVLKIHSFS